jgi:hypothetical protein
VGVMSKILSTVLGERLRTIMYWITARSVRIAGSGPDEAKTKTSEQSEDRHVTVEFLRKFRENAALLTFVKHEVLDNERNEIPLPLSSSLRLLFP